MSRAEGRLPRGRPRDTFRLIDPGHVVVPVTTPSVTWQHCGSSARPVRRLSAALLEALPCGAHTTSAAHGRPGANLPSRYAGPDRDRADQDDLTRLCEITRATASQLIGKLADKNLLEVARGRVIITDLPGLARTAG